MLHLHQLTTEEQQEIDKQLRYPFEPAEIEWVPLATADGSSGPIAVGAPYADARAYQERLDAVCGKNWTVRYRLLGTPTTGNVGMIAAVTIYGRTVEDVGECDAKDANAWTSACAQAFKRACSAGHGLGRYLYGLDTKWVPYNPQKKRITDEGIGILNKAYFAWYTRVTGKGRSQSQQPGQPAASPPEPAGTTPPAAHTPPPPAGQAHAGTANPATAGTPVSDATKLAIYAAAKAIFTENEWIAGLGWYTEAYTRVNLPPAGSKTNNPDLLTEGEAQGLLDALTRNSAVLPEYWAGAKAATSAATATKSNSANPTHAQPVPPSMAGARSH
jgi:hypothetical protein